MGCLGNPRSGPGGPCACGKEGAFLMDLQLLKQGLSIMSKCGAFTQVHEGAVLPLVKSFLMPMVLQPNQSLVFTKEITGDTVWNLRSISSDQGSNSLLGVRLQIQLPNGRFLFGGNGIDVGQFAWVGSWRYLMDPDLDCEPGSKIQVTLSDTTSGGLGAAVCVNLLFEGAYKFYFKGYDPVNWKDGLASQMPRYQGIVNENILAPPAIAGYGLETPPGFQDEYFIYSSPVVGLTIGAGTVATLKIPIDQGLDFICRRLLFDVIVAGTVTAATWLGRIRTGDGYALCEDFIDLARILNGSDFPHGWTIAQGDLVYIDLSIVDTTGAGACTIQAHLEGVRRKKVG